MNPTSEEAKTGWDEPLQSFPKPGDHKSITMATIAKAAGVSQGAISSLLNDRDYGIRVSEKTRERVFRTCREMGYIPNDLRAVVRMYPHLGDLCLLAPSATGNPFSDPFFSRIAAVAIEQSGVSRNAVTIGRYDVGTDYSGDPEILPHTIREGVSSKFIMVGPASVSLCQRIIQRGFPVVTVGCELSLPGVSSFVPDYAQASKIAIEYLHGLGHQRIVVLPGPFGTTDRAIIELNRGIKLGFDAISVPVEAQNLIYGELNYKTGFDAAELLLSRGSTPCALLCLSDDAAAGAIAAANAHGCPPETLSIMGCGNHAIASMIHPALTSVNLPLEEMAVAALKEVAARVAVEDVTTTRTTLLPVNIVERESCKPPKAS